MANIAIHNYGEVTSKPNRHKLGYSTGTTYYTSVKGKPAYLGTDGASEANKVVPVSNIDAQNPTYLIMTNETDAVNFAGGYVELVALNGAVITTDNLKAGDLPVVGSAVFINDAGEFAATDTDSAGRRAGICIPTFPGYSSSYRSIVLHIDKT